MTETRKECDAEAWQGIRDRYRADRDGVAPAHRALEVVASLGPVAPIVQRAHAIARLMRAAAGALRVAWHCTRGVAYTGAMVAVMVAAMVYAGPTSHYLKAHNTMPDSIKAMRHAPNIYMREDAVTNVLMHIKIGVDALQQEAEKGSPGAADALAAIKRKIDARPAPPANLVLTGSPSGR